MAKFAADLERRRPEPRTVADGHAADRIDDRERGNHDAIGGRRRSRADAALEIGRGRAHAGAGASEGERAGGRSGCGIAEIAIGRKPAPGLVAAVQQIEADRAGHDRNHGLADFKSAALLGQPGLHAARGVKAERRAAGERDRIDRLDGGVGLQQGVLARAGPAAAHVDRRHRRLVEDDRGDTRRQPGVIGVADADAGDIGEQVFQAASASLTGPCATGIAAGENASTAKRHPDHAGKLGLAVGFCQ